MQTPGLDLHREARCGDHGADRPLRLKNLLLTVCIFGLDSLCSLSHSIQDSPSTIAISIRPHQTRSLQQVLDVRMAPHRLDEIVLVTC